MLTKEELFELKIEKPDMEYYRRTKARWDRKAKPLDSLGDLETLVCRLASILRTEEPSIETKAAVILCADNGIVKEGVTQCGSEVTLSVASALGKGTSSACCIARSAGVRVLPVDIGMAHKEPVEGVLQCKVSLGTRDFIEEPAMTEEEALQAIETGIVLVEELSKEGIKIIAAGEMGIGNTTTSAAVLSALLSVDSDEVVGRGAGLDDAGLERKKQVVREGLAKYDLKGGNEGKEQAFRVLCSVGGLDIAGLVGIFLGGAKCRVPVVIDGVICAAAALLAECIAEGIKDFMIASHSGREAGLLMALKKLGLQPLINGNLALGEGTGAMLVFPLLETALHFYQNGAEFEDYGMDAYERFSK